MAKAKKPVDSPKDEVTDAVVADKDDTAPTSESDPKKSAFIPLVLGGVLSGAVGFGVAAYYFTSQPSDEAQALVQVQSTLDEYQGKFSNTDAAFGELSTAMNGLETGLDGKISGLAGTVAQKDGEMAHALSELSNTVAAFDVRLVALEKRPVAGADGMTSQAAAAYERELLAMRHLLEAQRNDIEKLAAEATARIESVAQQAATLEKTAGAAAKATALRSAVSQLQSALDNGGTLEATLADLAKAGVTTPQVLADAAKGGVPTLATLQEGFPTAARAGLAASVKAATGDGAMDKLGSFFRGQVGARSLTPREGDDPDAVLSRAEAALGVGDIEAALALIGALPEAGQTAMADWVSAAIMRTKAVDALHTLADGLNGN